MKRKLHALSLYTDLYARSLPLQMQNTQHWKSVQAASRERERYSNTYFSNKVVGRHGSLQYGPAFLHQCLVHCPRVSFKPECSWA